MKVVMAFDPHQTERPRDAKALLPRETDRSLPIALLKAREAVMAHFRPMLKSHGITEQQWRVIRVIAEAGTLDASEVVDRACILAPSLTRIIRSLEERSLITRHKDAQDGRRFLLELTPAGQDFIAAVSPDSRRIYQMIETSFGQERLDALLSELDALAALKD